MGHESYGYRTGGDRWVINAIVDSVQQEGRNLVLTLRADAGHPVGRLREPLPRKLNIRNFTRSVEVGWPISGMKFACLIGGTIYNRDGLAELTEKTDFHD